MSQSYSVLRVLLVRNFLSDLFLLLVLLKLSDIFTRIKKKEIINFKLLDCESAFAFDAVFPQGTLAFPLAPGLENTAQPYL